MHLDRRRRSEYTQLTFIKSDVHLPQELDAIQAVTSLYGDLQKFSATKIFSKAMDNISTSSLPELMSDFISDCQASSLNCKYIL